MSNPIVDPLRTAVRYTVQRLSVTLTTSLLLLGSLAGNHAAHAQEWNGPSLSAPPAESAANAIAAESVAESESISVQVGLMGQVVRPGVYTCSSQFPSLNALLTRAGGLTTKASKQLHIVRGGAARQTVYFDPASDVQLLPGDLVVIPEQATASTSARVIEVSDSGQQEPSTVQLAFVGLLDIPQVLRVSSSSASVGSLAAVLGQTHLERDVRVLTFGAASRVGAANQQGVLASGSVVVFPAALVKRARLPRFPEPIVEVEPEPPLPTDADAVPVRTAEQIDVEPDSEVVSVIEAGSVVPSELDYGQDADSGVLIANTPTPVYESQPTGTVAPTTSKSTSAPAATPADTQSRTVAWIVLGTGLLLVLVAGGIQIWLKTQPQTAVATPVVIEEARTEPERSWLDRLVTDEVPIETETVELPNGWTLHTESAGESQPATLPLPTSPALEPEVVANPRSSSDGQTAPATLPHPEHAASQQVTAETVAEASGLLERVLTSVQQKKAG